MNAAARHDGIDDRDFALFQKLLVDEVGIRLSDAKKPLLVSRLSKRLRELGVASFGEYHARVRGEAAERIRMIDLVTTNETHFFREPKQFEFLESVAIPAWRAAADAGTRERALRIWSAGCSTGEEPYSLAMLLMAHLPEWRLRIVGTDISTRVLDRAAAAEWPLDKADEVPRPFLRRFMLRGIGAKSGTMRLHPDVRNVVELRRLNLNDDRWPLEGAFDLVLCRNVMIYFDGAARLRLIERLVDRCKPGAWLFVGHAESLSGTSPRLESVRPTIWKRR